MNQDKYDSVKFNNAFEQQVSAQKLKFQKYYNDKLDDLNKISNPKVPPTSLDIFLEAWNKYLKAITIDIKSGSKSGSKFIEIFYKDDRLLYTGITILFICLLFLILNKLFEDKEDYIRTTNINYTYNVSQDSNNLFRQIFDYVKILFVKSKE